MKKIFLRFWVGFFIIFILSSSLNADYKDSSAYKDIKVGVEKATNNFIIDKSIKLLINTTMAKSIYFIQDIVTTKLSVATIKKTNFLGNAAYDIDQLLLKAFKKKGIEKTSDIKKIISKLDLALLPLDVAVEFSKLYYTKNLSEKYKKPVQWWIDIAYIHLKASIMSGLGLATDAMAEEIVGHIYVLQDMAVANYDAFNSWRESKLTLAYSKAMGKAMIISYKYEKMAYKTSSHTVSYIMYALFHDEYHEKIIKPLQDKLIKTEYTYKLINKLFADLSWRQNHISRIAERGRYILLDKNINTYKKNNFIKFIKYYFPDNQYQTLLKKYDDAHFDFKIGSRIDSTAYPFLKRLYDYDIVWQLNKKSIFDETELLTPRNAFAYIIGVSHEISKKEKFGRFILYLSADKKVKESLTWKNATTISKKEIAKEIVNYFKLEDKLTQKQKTKFAILGNKLQNETRYSLILKHFKIINSKRTVMLNDNIKSLTLLKWVTKAKEIKHCNYVGCERVINILISNLRKKGNK